MGSSDALRVCGPCVRIPVPYHGVLVVQLVGIEQPFINPGGISWRRLDWIRGVWMTTDRFIA